MIHSSGGNKMETSFLDYRLEHLSISPLLPRQFFSERLFSKAKEESCYQQNERLKPKTVNMFLFLNEHELS